MSAEDEVTAMQVETDDFIYSLTAGDADGNEQTEIITSDHSGIPADLVHTDVSDLENNASLWLDGLEGALESNDGVSNMPHHVTSHLVEDHAQMSESMAHMTEVEGVEPNSLGVAEVEGHAELEGQSQEVENVTMEPMDVDVQTTEVSSIELTEMRLENFMEQTDVGINPDSSSTVTKEDVPLIPVTLSLPSVEPRAILPSVQQRKTTITIPSSSQVTKVVLSPAGQNQSGQPLLFTVPSSATGLTSLLTPSANLRFVNAVGSSGGTKVTNVGSSLASGATSHPMRLMSPTKTITLQQAQQLGLISPKKGQSLVINKVNMASGGPSTTSSALLTGKPGAKFAGGNVTLVRSAPTKTPTKIAPAPPQSVVTTVASSSTATQPTSLLIKNAAGQVTMATLVQARPNSAGIANLGTMSPQKFVLRPATTGSIASAQVRQGSGAPAQYIRLTTAQALAAGILPAVGAHSDGSHQQLQLAGNKIQLVRVVTPSQIAANNSSGNIAVSNSSKMVLGSSSSTVKITTHSLAQSQANKSIMSSVSKPQVKISTSSSQTGVPPGVQRILLPAGSMSSISNNIVMLPAHYSSQNLASAGSNANVAISLTTNTNTMVSDATSLPVMSSTSARSSFSTKNYVSPPSPESSQPSTPGSKTQGVLESNGLKPRKPCNCTKSQCLKLYCDCFANGEFCHGCNCVCCANNLEHEELRLRAIRSCLDRNPHAFKPKIGVGWGPEPRRHNKGCHCKRSGCLKNYCECYEAKIACSAICKCIGCKNCVDPIASPPGTGEKRNSKVAALISHPSNTPEGRTVSNIVPQSSIKVEERTSDPPKGSATTASSSSSRPPFSFITQEVVEATCQCLLAQAEEAERQCKSSVETEGLVLEEFGRCLLQIIEYASKAKVTASP